MRSRRFNHRKGSVIVMVVALLVMLGMVIMTFIAVAHMDRKEAVSIATAASMKQVADGLVQRIRTELAAGLRIDDRGTADPGDDVVYGLAADWKQQVVFPHEDCSKVLAVFGPVNAGGTLIWRHVCNVHGAAAGVTDLAIDDATLADTDGYGYEFPAGSGNWHYGDAVLWNSGITDRTGREYWVAVRIVDASALLNANTAYSSDPAAAGIAMPATNVSLAVLTSAAIRDTVHDERNGSTNHDIATYNANFVQRPLNPAVNTYLPFDISDMLAVVWGRAVPNTATGRLHSALGGQFLNAKPFLTTQSAYRIFARRVAGNLDQKYRTDLNSADFPTMFTAFYNAVPAGVTGLSDDDITRRKTAVQLAVNVIDFRDPDNNVTVPTNAELALVGLPAGLYFGVERQPFVTELFYKVYNDSSDPPVPTEYSAIELFNPYMTALNIGGLRLTDGAGTEQTPTGGWPATIPGGRRIVIVSDKNTVPVHAEAAHVVEIIGLDLAKEVKIYRSRNGDGSGVKDVLLADVTLTVDDPGAGAEKHTVLQWDDRLPTARYALDETRTLDIDYTNENGGGATAVTTNLGRANHLIPDFSALTSKPCPVYVRNDQFVNVGELNRIFYVGPTETKSLRGVLAATDSISNGRLAMLSGIKAGGYGAADIPNVPLGCLLADYLMVASPMSDTIDNDGDGLIDAADNNGGEDIFYGAININTAPEDVLASLPALAGLSANARRKIVREIVAYRDLLNNVPNGGNDYSADRAAATGITDLRNERGFACAAEIAIPIYLRGAKADIAAAARLPQNNYSPLAPFNYSLGPGANNDDGLNSAVGQSVVGDLAKHHIYYAWLANQVTVRSDVFIAYIRVQIGSDPTAAGGVRRYVAVFDRSNCRSAGDLPRVLMFTEMR